jgi:hypothetical protein
MKNRAIFFIVLLGTLVSCDFSRSVHKDLSTGMVTRGEGLSCDNAEIIVNDEVVRNTTFTFGERVQVKFNNMDGFTRMDGKAFPGMSIISTNREGDTLLYVEDTYESMTEGYTFDPLVLTARFNAADPYFSNHEYHQKIRIWDKKDERRQFTAGFDFDVVPNDLIVAEEQGLTYKELYLFSGDRDQAVTDNRIGINELINVVFIGLAGFMEEEGRIYPEMSMRIEDAGGEVVVEESEMVGDHTMDPEELSSYFAPNFYIADPSLENPVTFRLELWDKKDDGRLSVYTQVEVVSAEKE